MVHYTFRPILSFPSSLCPLLTHSLSFFLIPYPTLPYPLWLSIMYIGENIRTDLCRMQQLVEIQEVTQLMKFPPTGRGGGSGIGGGGLGIGGGGRVDALLRTWKGRLVGCTRASLLGGPVITHRLALVDQLLRANRATPRQALQVSTRTRAS